MTGVDLARETRAFLARAAALAAAATAFLVILPGAAPSLAATQLFASGFERTTGLGTPYGCSISCWQDITGTDWVTGNTWPPEIWGGTGSLQFWRMPT